jgi:hypothetical protein
VFVQHRLILPHQISGAFDSSNPYDQVSARETKSEDGEQLSEWCVGLSDVARFLNAELKPVYEQLPKSIGDARTFLGEVSFAQDGRSFYRPESVDWEKRPNVKLRTSTGAPGLGALSPLIRSRTSYC